MSISNNAFNLATNHQKFNVGINIILLAVQTFNSPNQDIYSFFKVGII